VSVRVITAWASTKALNCELCKYEAKGACSRIPALRMECSETGEVCRCEDYFGNAYEDSPKAARFDFEPQLEFD